MSEYQADDVPATLEAGETVIARTGSAVLVLHLEGDAPLLVELPRQVAEQCAAAVRAYWCGEPMNPPLLELGEGDRSDTWLPMARVTTVRVLDPERAAALYPDDIESGDEDDRSIATGE